MSILPTPLRCQPAASEPVQATRAERSLLPPRVFGRFVMRADGCWPWIESKTAQGYGLMWDGQRTVLVHRYVWEHINGRVPDGLVVMHSCDYPTCMRPSHLSVGTYAENEADKWRKGREYDIGASNRAKTQCPQGHPYDDENTHWYRGRRYCWACHLERNAGRL